MTWAPSSRPPRSVRVFSIDPPTAKDLDDALSIQPLDLGPGRGSGWRVGVHIADVAYFIPPFRWGRQGGPREGRSSRTRWACSSPHKQSVHSRKRAAWAW